MTTYSRNLNGSNCHLSGQPILSLQVTEDVGTDFASASVTTLAPDGAHGVRSVVETVEGGTSTGSWVVVKSTLLTSGEKTWRRRAGDAFYRHLTYVTYRLRRAGYLEARATISEANVGSDHWPAKFWSAEWYRLKKWDLYQDFTRGEISFWEYNDTLKDIQVVASGSELIRKLAGWFGLSVGFRTSCPVLPEEYVPVGQTLLSSIREIASWSGADVYLGRTGLVVYSFEAEFGRGGSLPRPASVLEHENVEELPTTTLVSVVGENYSHQRTLEEWGTRTEDEDGNVTWEPPKWALERQARPVEYSTHIQGQSPYVEERHEVKEHSISTALAQHISRQKISHIMLEHGIDVWRGPAEGSQGVCPLASRVFGINRTLQWDGQKYRYEIEIRGPRGAVVWDTPELEGWW